MRKRAQPVPRRPQASVAKCDVAPPGVANPSAAVGFPKKLCLAAFFFGKSIFRGGKLAK